MKNDGIGLVLSGGGYRGAAHAGALMAFEEYGIIADFISGSSAGAMVGALYAADYKPKEIKDFFEQVKIFSLSRYSFKKPGLVDTDSFKSVLEEYFPDDSFDILSKKLYICVTDLLSGTSKILDEGSLITAVLASASVPGIFTPIAINNNLYADGGIMNNFPLEPLIDCQEIYGVDVSPIVSMKSEEFKYAYQVVNRAFHLRMHQDSEAKHRFCKLVVQPFQLAQYTTFNSSHVAELFEIGYQSALSQLKENLGKQIIKI